MATRDNEKEDLRMLFQTRVNEITYFKKQQWQATNYAMLSYVVIFLLMGILVQRKIEIGLEMKFSATILIGFIFLAVRSAIFSLTNSLDASRQSVDAVLPFMSKRFNKCYDVKWSRLKKEERDWPFPFLFHAYNLIGAIIVLLLLWLTRWEQVPIAQ